MQTAGTIRRRQKLEPPTSANGGFSADDSKGKSRRKTKRRPVGRSAPLVAGLTAREWALVLITAIVVYFLCRGRAPPVSNTLGGGYASVLSAKGTSGGLVPGTAQAAGGGHPRDPPYLRDLLPHTETNVRRIGSPSASGDSSRRFAPVPEASQKTFYYDNEKISMPVVRAFRSRGWQKVDEIEDAHMVYTYKQREDIGDDLEAWQRFNLIPGADEWNDKWSFVKQYKEWEARQKEAKTDTDGDGGDDDDNDDNANDDNGGDDDDGTEETSANHKDYSSFYVPESYMLTGAENTEDRLAFARILETDAGANHPWVMKQGDVNQGRGITILAPNSPELMEAPYKFERKEEEKEEEEENNEEENEEEEEEEEDELPSDVIVQKYVCNEMTWNRRKFDVRVFWMVASLDPLIVLYHDGYVRIGNADYSEQDFSDTTKHLTTHTKLGAEGKATWDEFASALDTLAPPDFAYPEGVTTPVEHVRNQMKAALAEMTERFKPVSFVPNPDDLPTENSYSFYCADFILDNDLDVWFLEPQYGCGLDEDYYFRLEMHASLFNGMIDVLDEIWTKQQDPNAEGKESLLPLQHQGNWEVLYLGSEPTTTGSSEKRSSGKAFTYSGYKRSRNKAGCETETSESSSKD